MSASGRVPPLTTGSFAAIRCQTDASLGHGSFRGNWAAVRNFFDRPKAVARITSTVSGSEVVGSRSSAYGSFAFTQALAAKKSYD